MKLNTITEGTWNIIASYLNYNFNKLSVATSKLKDVKLVSFKGVYTSESELKTSQNTSVPGDYAFVLVRESREALFRVYYTDFNYDWVTDNGIYNPEVILSNYIEVIALSNISQIDKDIDNYNKGKI